MKKTGSILSAVMAIAVILLAQQAIAAKTTKEVSPYPLGERSINSERALAERIAPSANVCVKGEECKVAVVAVAAPKKSGPRDGAAVYASCAGCHSGALPNAPAKGDKAAWSARKSANGGLDGLLKSAITGTSAGMPAKGACGDCSDAELKAAIEYMMK